MNLPSLLEAKKRSNKEVLTKTIDYITSNDLKNIGSGKKYFIKTYGCQMNEHDTENIKAILEDIIKEIKNMGYEFKSLDEFK